MTWMDYKLQEEKGIFIFILNLQENIQTRLEGFMLIFFFLNKYISKAQTKSCVNLKEYFQIYVFFLES